MMVKHEAEFQDWCHGASEGLQVLGCFKKEMLTERPKTFEKVEDRKYMEDKRLIRHFSFISNYIKVSYLCNK